MLTKHFISLRPNISVVLFLSAIFVFGKTCVCKDSASKNFLIYDILPLSKLRAKNSS